MKHEQQVGTTPRLALRWLTVDSISTFDRAVELPVGVSLNACMHVYMCTCTHLSLPPSANRQNHTHIGGGGGGTVWEKLRSYHTARSVRVQLAEQKIGRKLLLTVCSNNAPVND